MHKAIQHVPGLWRLIAALDKLRASFKFEIPVGYQDENGFHYGVKPAAKTDAFPTVW